MRQGPSGSAARERRLIVEEAERPKPVTEAGCPLGTRPASKACRGCDAAVTDACATDLSFDTADLRDTAPAGGRLQCGSKDEPIWFNESS